MVKKIRLLLRFKNISVKVDYLSDWLLFAAVLLFVAYMLFKFYMQCVLLVCIYL